VASRVPAHSLAWSHAEFFAAKLSHAHSGHKVTGQFGTASARHRHPHGIGIGIGIGAA
jgi:hypothetical protein